MQVKNMENVDGDNKHPFQFKKYFNFTKILYTKEQ